MLILKNRKRRKTCEEMEGKGFIQHAIFQIFVEKFFFKPI